MYDSLAILPMGWVKLGYQLVLSVKRPDPAGREWIGDTRFGM